MLRALLLIAVVLALFVQGAAESRKRVEIVRAPGVVHEWQSIIVVIRTEPDERNRWLQLLAADQGCTVILEDCIVSKGNLEAMDGLDAKVIREVRWMQGLTSGEFMLVAVLTEAGGKRLTATWPIQVLGVF